MDLDEMYRFKLHFTLFGEFGILCSSLVSRSWCFSCGTGDGLQLATVTNHSAASGTLLLGAA